MMPILTSIIAGEGDKTSPMRGFTLALSYVMGMAIDLHRRRNRGCSGRRSVASDIQPAMGTDRILRPVRSARACHVRRLRPANAEQHPERLAAVSGNQKSGTTIGAFVMGALSALIVTACVAPALIAALTVMAQTGDMMRGGTALFAMSLGMGAPLLLVGAAQGQLLPKAGAWMVAVKTAFGFMLLGLAIWMLSRISAGQRHAGPLGCADFHVGRFHGRAYDAGPGLKCCAEARQGIWLSRNYLRAVAVAWLADGRQQSTEAAREPEFWRRGRCCHRTAALKFQRIKTVDDLDREIAAAASQGKTAMLDFYADWCVSCKEMEEYTFTDAGVQAALANTVLLQADVTANDEADQALLQRFGVFGPPTIIFFGTDGQQRHGYEVVGYMKAMDFTDHLRQAFSL